ncbi:MAG TPA: TerC family protein [Actinomycetes bacterium]
MDVSPAVWGATLAGILAVIAIDLVAVSRRPHRPTMRESTAWVFFYIALALAFGAVVAVAFGSRYAGEFYAGWLTEYSLSVDNLFVFVIIMSRFRVPATAQQTVLIIGVILALVFRGIFIALGAAAIARFSWVFYLFGAFLLYTAYKLFSHDEDEEDEFKGNALLRLVRRVVPTAPDYDGIRLRTTVAGRRLFTPMLVVMVAIGTTDVLFALDSIPAIFGLTKEPYLVFTANAFALMGLVQLYFLLGGLLDRLVFLGRGLAVVLAFIGVKLVLEALHTNTLPFINGGEPVPWAPVIPITLSLVVIVVILGVTAVASLLHTRRTAQADG